MNDLELEIMALENAAEAANLSRFFKTGKGGYAEGDIFLGVKVPQTRSLVRRYWDSCTMDDLERMIVSEYHEIRLGALLVLVQKYKHAKNDSAKQDQYVSFYLAHTASINNWDLVDLSCYELLGDWLLSRDRSVLYALAGKDRTLWENRIAIVTCMQFVRHGETSDCMSIADLLLSHPNDLIHKAVGWLLREVGKHDGELLRCYLVRRINDMSRTTLRYAIEKFPESERKSILAGTWQWPPQSDVQIASLAEKGESKQ